MFSIYFLGDPILHEFRYVGQTSKNPDDRLKQHIKLSRFPKTYVHRWARTLLNQGLSPQLFIITEVKTKEEADILEKYWIRQLREIGCPLTNLTDGGEGSPGSVHSEETKRKMSKAARGRCLSEDHKKNLSKASKGTHWSEERKKKALGRHLSKETRIKISESRKGRYKSEEHKKKLSEALIGRHLSEETKQKMSESQKRRQYNEKERKR